MKASGQAVLPRIYTDEDAVGDRSLLDNGVKRASEPHLASATVLRGCKGLGGAARLHKVRLSDLNDNLPVLRGIVDEEARLPAFRETLADLKDIGLVTSEKVEVFRYGGQHTEPHE